MKKVVRGIFKVLILGRFISEKVFDLFLPVKKSKGARIVEMWDEQFDQSSSNSISGMAKESNG